jgi:outer membrane protein OmpA-like peptidoglycan-associated protein
MGVPRRALIRVLRLRDLGLPAIFAAVMAATSPAVQGQAAAPARDEIVNALSSFESGPELDIPALKQKIIERSRVRSKKEPEASKRPPIVPELQDFPTLNVAIQFDVDTPIILPESYETMGRIADAFVNAPLLPFSFLIVGHSDSNGKSREANVILSQRRADAVREVLVNTFKISAKRIQSLGVGEEQFIDQGKPASPVNLQIQILTVAKTPDQQPAAPPAAATPAAKKSAKKKK